MKIIVKYVKRGYDDKDCIRQQAITSKGKSWKDHGLLAGNHQRDGERIISIAEAGYH